MEELLIFLVIQDEIIKIGHQFEELMIPDCLGEEINPKINWSIKDLQPSILEI